MTVGYLLLTLGMIGLSWPFVWYPWLLHFFPKQDLAIGPFDPTVGISVIIPCYNESSVIEKKLQEIIEQVGNRPTQIIVADDGSTDDTAERAKKISSPGITIEVLQFPRLGKGEVLNRVWPHLHYDIVVITDANSTLQPLAMTNLLNPFSHPAVGEVRGRFLPQPVAVQSANHAGRYQDFNHRLFMVESQRGVLHVSGGALQAFRRSLHDPKKPLTMTEDWDMTLEVVTQGKRLIYAPQAVATKRVTVMSSEIRSQQVRLVYGTLQTMWKYRRLTQVWRYKLLSLAFFSGKPAQVTGPWWGLLALWGLIIVGVSQPWARLLLNVVLIAAGSGLILVLFNFRRRRIHVPVLSFVEQVLLLEGSTAWAWILYVFRGGKNWPGWQPIQSVRLPL